MPQQWHDDVRRWQKEERNGDLYITVNFNIMFLRKNAIDASNATTTEATTSIYNFYGDAENVNFRILKSFHKINGE